MKGGTFARSTLNKGYDNAALQSARLSAWLYRRRAANCLLRWWAEGRALGATVLPVGSNCTGMDEEHTTLFIFPQRRFLFSGHGNLARCSSPPAGVLLCLLPEPAATIVQHLVPPWLFLYDDLPAYLLSVFLLCGALNWRRAKTPKLPRLRVQGRLKCLATLC